MDNIETVVQKITDIIIQRLQKEEHRKTVVFLGKEYSSIRTYYENRGYEIASVKDESDTDIVIVTELTILNMNRIALGLPQTEDEVVIFQRLLNKKKVFFLEEGMELYASQHVAPRALLQVLENYKNQLVRYGASILPLKHFEKINETINQEVKDITNKSDRKELLTIAKVRKLNLHAGDIFETDKNIIVTALARDYLRDLGVEIV
jgi:ethanolamine utilization protein